MPRREVIQAAHLLLDQNRVELALRPLELVWTAALPQKSGKHGLIVSLDGLYAHARATQLAPELRRPFLEAVSEMNRRGTLPDLYYARVLHYCCTGKPPGKSPRKQEEATATQRIARFRQELTPWATSTNAGPARAEHGNTHRIKKKADALGTDVAERLSAGDIRNAILIMLRQGSTDLNQYRRLGKLILEVGSKHRKTHLETAALLLFENRADLAFALISPIVESYTGVAVSYPVLELYAGCVAGNSKLIPRFDSLIAQHMKRRWISDAESQRLTDLRTGAVVLHVETHDDIRRAYRAGEAFRDQHKLMRSHPINKNAERVTDWWGRTSQDPGSRHPADP